MEITLHCCKCRTLYLCRIILHQSVIFVYWLWLNLDLTEGCIVMSDDISQCEKDKNTSRTTNPPHCPLASQTQCQCCVDKARLSDSPQNSVLLNLLKLSPYMLRSDSYIIDLGSWFELEMVKLARTFNYGQHVCMLFRPCPRSMAVRLDIQIHVLWT